MIIYIHYVLSISVYDEPSRVLEPRFAVAGAVELRAELFRGFSSFLPVGLGPRSSLTLTSDGASPWSTSRHSESKAIEACIVAN